MVKSGGFRIKNNADWLRDYVMTGEDMSLNLYIDMEMDMAMYMDLWIYRSMDLYHPYQNSSIKSFVKNSLMYAIWGEVWQYQYETLHQESIVRSTINPRRQKQI
jgi:hypothetical protein